ncbi:hypothetical protein [Corynebacterium urogenitale]
MHATQLPDTLVPASEIEARWHISSKTLRRRAADGTITAYRFGHRTVRYNPEEIFANLVTTSRSWEVA